MDNKAVLNEMLKGYCIKAVCESVCAHNNFDIFYLKLLSGCKISALESVSREIQLTLKLDTPPVFVPDYKSGRLQMISAKKTKEKLDFKSVFKSKNVGSALCQVGMDSTGNVLEIDLTEMPHMLVTGTTGSGKSVFLNVLIANIFAMRDDAILYLVDPKQVEFSGYLWLSGTNISKLAYNLTSTLLLLDEVEKIMNKRYQWMSEHGYRSVKDFAPGVWKNIFIIIDEFSDLVLKDKKGEFTTKLCRMAAKSRAAGIHFIIATQRASVNVVNGLIKANFPVRVVFKVASSIESRIVIDMNGAENLASRGDGLISGYSDLPLTRFKSAFVDYDGVVSYTNRLRVVA